MIRSTYRLDECPIPDKEKKKLEELLVQFGTVGKRVLEVREDLDVVLRQVKEIAEYIVADAECFGYETEEDYKEIVRGVEWLQKNIAA